jgi:Protein  of unknown function (DUF3018)
MARASGAKPTRAKVREHRERLRPQGLRPIQICAGRARIVLPVGGAPAIVGVAASAHAAEDQALIDAVSGWDDE